MRRAVSIRAGLAIGLACTLAFAATAAVVEAFGDVPSPAYRLFEWVAGALPGAVATKGIDLVVMLVRTFGASSTADSAKLVEHVLAYALVGMLGATAGAILAASRRTWIGIAVGVASALGYALIARGSGWHVLLGCVGIVLWGGGMSALFGVAGHRETDPDRRHVLAAIAAAAAGICALAFGVVRVATRAAGHVTRRLNVEDEAAHTSGPAASPDRAELAGRIEPVPGTRPELTATPDFYRVDINLTPPIIDGTAWRLSVDGMVARPRTFGLDELRARPAVDQIITLECISNPIGGDLISTSRWTGLRTADLLEELGTTAAARALSFEAADGFHETASIDELRDPRSLLVYAMNGEPLTAEHGYPLRLYVPDRHGMKLPKWITHIEAVATPRPGYWVERGWSATAIPHTTSVIDAVEGDGRMLAIGGIAYAGARGIRAVEVQLDDGPWLPARLRAPALGPLTWVQWRIDVPYRSGRHAIRVRAYDGTGALQVTSVRPPHPDGATGLYVKRVDV